MNANASYLPIALGRLEEAERNCDLIAAEWDEHFGDAGRPPDRDVVKFFMKRATESQNIKLSVLAVLPAFGDSAAPWISVIEKIDMSEKYATRDYMFPRAKRPSRSGLVALGHAVEAARNALASGIATNPQSESRKISAERDISPDNTTAKSASSERLLRAFPCPGAAKALKEFRKSKGGVSLAKLSSLWNNGVSEKTLGHVANGKPVAHRTLETIAEKLGISVEQLQDGQWRP